MALVVAAVLLPASVVSAQSQTVRATSVGSMPDCSPSSELSRLDRWRACRVKRLYTLIMGLSPIASEEAAAKRAGGALGAAARLGTLTAWDIRQVSSDITGQAWREEHEARVLHDGHYVWLDSSPYPGLNFASIAAVFPRASASPSA